MHPTHGTDYDAPTLGIAASIQVEVPVAKAGSPRPFWPQFKSKRFSHVVLLSRTLGPSNIFVLRRSVTHSCKHLFVCPCAEAFLPDDELVSDK